MMTWFTNVIFPVMRNLVWIFDFEATEVNFTFRTPGTFLHLFSPVRESNRFLRELNYNRICSDASIIQIISVLKLSSALEEDAMGGGGCGWRCRGNGSKPAATTQILASVIYLPVPPERVISIDVLFSSSYEITANSGPWFFDDAALYRSVPRWFWTAATTPAS